MNDSKYNLLADVTAVLHGTSLCDPGEIADKVAESVPSRMLRHCLRMTLRQYVASVMRQERDTNSSGSSQSPRDTQGTAAAAGSSWKRNGIRDGWRRHLTDRYAVAGVWMSLAEMTHDHLITAAVERETLAAANVNRAARLRDWADLLHVHKATTFGDLPANIQAKVLS